MACVVLADIVMAYGFMAEAAFKQVYSHGLHSYGLCSHCRSCLQAGAHTPPTLHAMRSHAALTTRHTSHMRPWQVDVQKICHPAVWIGGNYNDIVVDFQWL